MEKLKPKHDHALTNIVKVFIFALMLLMPFLVFLPNGLYYGFNEHATNDIKTEITYKYESNEVNSINDLVANNIYFLDVLDMEYDYNEDFEFNIISCETLDYLSGDVSWNDFNVSDYLNSQYDYLSIYNSQYTLNLNYHFNLETYNEIIIENEFHLVFSDVVFYCSELYLNSFKSYLTITQSNLPTYTDYNVIESVTENVEQTITQQMYNGWQQMWETPLFSWTSNSILNTGLTAFCTAFGISNTSYITNFLTYELVIVAIYIVLDIVLTLFTWLTHIGQKD